MAGKKITGRTKQLSLKSTPEFHKELKTLASEKKCLMIEILEKSFEGYKQELIKQKIDKTFIPKVEVPLIRIDKRSFDNDIQEEQGTSSKKRKIGD